MHEYHLHSTAPACGNVPPTKFYHLLVFRFAPAALASVAKHFQAKPGVRGRPSGFLDTPVDSLPGGWPSLASAIKSTHEPGKPASQPSRKDQTSVGWPRASETERNGVEYGTRRRRRRSPAVMPGRPRSSVLSQQDAELEGRTDNIEWPGLTETGPP